MFEAVSTTAWKPNSRILIEILYIPAYSSLLIDALFLFGHLYEGTLLV